jgi:cysteine-rich repeat protein
MHHMKGSEDMTAKHTIRRTKPWMALAATMALSLAMGTLAPPEGHTATGQLKKQCKKTCKTQKKVCLKSFKAQFKAAKKACKLEADKAAKKQCKKDAKAASKDNKTACKTGFKDDCKQCCSDQDDIAMCNVAVCGDGQIAGTEQCEDGNQVGGDGCSADCLIETAFEGGTRNFTYSDGSAFFTSFVGMNSIGTPMGTLPLVATPADENGVAQVTVQGPIYTFWDVDALGQNRRVCNKIESCTGTLYCDGGFNVDVDVVLNSVFGSTAQTLEDTLTDSACMHTGVCDGEPCCENACEGFGMGRCENNGALCADDTG